MPGSSFALRAPCSMLPGVASGIPRTRWPVGHRERDTTSQPRKGDVTGCQFGALGACPVVSGGCPHPTRWWGHPNHRQLHQKVLGTRDPTTARHIRCLRGVCEARRRSPPRDPCAPAPRSIIPRGRLVWLVVLRAAPGTPCPARRKPNYCDSNLALQRSVVVPVRASILHDDAAPLLQTIGVCYRPAPAADSSREWRWLACTKKLLTVLTEAVWPATNRQACRRPRKDAAPLLQNQGYRPAGTDGAV
jgi:hypothetical protein